MRVALLTVGSGDRSLDPKERLTVLAECDEIGRHQLVGENDAEVCLVVDLHALGEGDSFPKALRELDVSHSRLRVYDQRDNAVYTYAGLYVAPRGRLLRRDRQRAAPYAVTPAPDVGFVTGVPDLLFSFQGSTATHPIRPALLGSLSDHPRGLVEEAGASFWNDEPTDQVRRRAGFREALERSKFVLCPRGFGPSSFRLYETLAAGRVPVVLSDEWQPPAGIDWNACSIRIPERDVARVPAILESRESDWNNLAAAARRAHEANFAPGRLWDYLINQLETVRPSPSLRPWWADRSILRRRGDVFKHRRA